MLADLPVLRDRAWNRTTVSTSVSLAANDTGVNSSTSMVEPKSAKNAANASLPRRTPYHGAPDEAASAAQSTSSVTASRIAATSPRPKASYTPVMVLMLASALIGNPSLDSAAVSTGTSPRPRLDRLACKSFRRDSLTAG